MGMRTWSSLNVAAVEVFGIGRDLVWSRSYIQERRETFFFNVTLGFISFILSSFLLAETIFDISYVTFKNKISILIEKIYNIF